ncbi:MAG: methyltransferase domain-containing protein [Mariprofundales bacterium]
MTKQGKVISVLPGGEACVHMADDSICLVRSVLPQEEIIISPLPKRRGTLRGKLVDILKPSSERVDSGCAVYPLCGGCALRQQSLSAQMRTKSDWVYQGFTKWIKPNTAWHTIIEHAGDGTRRRAYLHASIDERGIYFGFYAFTSNKVIRNEHCPVLDPDIEYLRLNLNLPKELWPNISSLLCTKLDDGMHVVIGIDSDGLPNLPQWQQWATTKLIYNNNPIQWWLQTNNNVLTPLTRPVLALHDVIGEIQMRVAPTGFIQGHASGNINLVNIIARWCANARHVADLFCGAGNLSLPLAAKGISIIGADSDNSSVQQANANAKRLKLNAHYQCLDLFRSQKLEKFAGMDVLILDPPRKGARLLCAQLSTLLPSKIILCSCDLASGKRDAAAIAATGYKLIALYALDLFAHAGHVETVSIWSR